MTDPAFLAALNAERARVGSGPLAADPRCEAAALDLAADNARRDLLTHAGSDGSTPQRRALRHGVAGPIGEVAAQGWPPTPGFPGYGPLDALDAWRHSPGHWSILTRREHDRIGLASAVSGRGVPYAVAVLAGPDGGPGPQPSRPVPSWLDRLFGWLRRG